MMLLHRRIEELEKNESSGKDDSDILGGLPTSKKQRIINEVEELYAKNIQLEQKNNELAQQLLGTTGPDENENSLLSMTDAADLG